MVFLLLLLFGAAVVVLAILYNRARNECITLRERFAAMSQKAAMASLQAEQRGVDLNRREALDTVKDEFISTVSHELRTPLTSIRGALGLLSASLMGKVDDKSANLLRIASTNTDRLVRLINDILDLERMESGRAPLHIRKVSPRDLMQQAVDTMSSMGEASHVSLEIVQDLSAATVHFDADPDRVLQVLTNLLSNAIKFSPAGCSVLLRASTEGPSVVFKVTDAGRGVPQDKLESIFGRFNQVDPSDARQKGGTGLGLAICRSIAAQHGGTIWAERNDHRSESGVGGAGTTFYLRLPRRNNVQELIPAKAEVTGAVLVVDDDAGVRHVVAERLRHHGYTVLEADNGMGAIHLAQTEPVEAILLDLYMPGLSGWETIERLKNEPATSAIPVVVLSVLAQTTRNSAGPLVKGAEGWVQKPFNESLVLAELGRVLHRGAGPGRILLVEDDHDLATLILSSFEAGTESGAGPEDVTVEHVASLATAKLACELHSPELLILDLALPDGSGFAMVEWLRTQPALRTLPLVVYSGKDLTADEMRQLRLGPTQFLSKARVQPNDLEGLVLSMMRNLTAPGNGLGNGHGTGIANAAGNGWRARAG